MCLFLTKVCSKHDKELQRHPVLLKRLIPTFPALILLTAFCLCHIQHFVQSKMVTYKKAGFMESLQD